MADFSNTGGYYPPYSFYFKVEFPGLTGDTRDFSFQSVSGLSVEFETESYKEGGENRFEHKLPVRSKYNTLQLKRGLLTDSAVLKWCKDAFESMIFKPTNVVVKLLNESGEPLKTWNVVQAWPKKWSVADFNANENSVVIETLELEYQYFTTI